LIAGEVKRARLILPGERHASTIQSRRLTRLGPVASATGVKRTIPRLLFSP
jgi:hypothetical protein